MTRMTASELKRQVKAHNPKSRFFNSKTMKSFDDTVHNYDVRITDVELDNAFDRDGSRIVISVWELYRKHPVGVGLTFSAFFTMDDFKLIRPRRDFVNWTGFNA